MIGPGRTSIRNETYLVESNLEEVEEAFEGYLEGLEDEMENVEAVESEEDYSFNAAGSRVNISYGLDEFREGTKIEMEFSGAGPVVDRFYNHFSDAWTSGSLSDI
ncbi:MAG: hypothetical protein ABEJ95_04120 [Candidatus Nanohalobium sp.]